MKNVGQIALYAYNLYACPPALKWLHTLDQSAPVETAMDALTYDHRDWLIWLSNWSSHPLHATPEGSNALLTLSAFSEHERRIRNQVRADYSDRLNAVLNESFWKIWDEEMCPEADRLVTAYWREITLPRIRPAVIAWLYSIEVHDDRS